MAPRPALLDSTVVQAKLGQRPRWQLANGRLCRTFEFDDFKVAFGWMTSVALVAESLDHHPRWTNEYRAVAVELWTHDVGGLTELDFALAGAMDELAEPLQR